MIQWSSKSFNQEIPARCLGSGDESCIPKVAREVPLFEDPLCAMGVPWRFDCLGRKAGEKWIPMDSDSFSGWFAAKNMVEVMMTASLPSKVKFQQATSTKDPYTSKLPPVIFEMNWFSLWLRSSQDAFSSRRRSGAFFSRPTSPTTRWWTQTPSYQMERCTERGGRKGRGEKYTSYTTIPVCLLIRFHVHVYNCCIYNYIYCYKSLYILYIYILLYCYILLLYMCVYIYIYTCFSLTYVIIYIYICFSLTYVIDIYIYIHLLLLLRTTTVPWNFSVICYIYIYI